MDAELADAVAITEEIAEAILVVVRIMVSELTLLPELIPIGNFTISFSSVATTKPLKSISISIPSLNAIVFGVWSAENATRTPFSNDANIDTLADIRSMDHPEFNMFQIIQRVAIFLSRKT